MYLIEQAERFRERPALRSDAVELSFGELLDKSADVAASLLQERDSLGGERIVSLLPPSIDYVTLQWAVWRAGGIFVPLPPVQPESELSFVLKDLSPSSIVVPLNHQRQRTIEGVPVQRFSSLTPAIKGDLPSLNPYDVAMILYTSGTTGTPKGVVVTHQNLEAQIKSLQKAWGWTEQDRILLTLPLYHVHGIVNILCSSLASGAVCTIHENFDAERTWRELNRQTLFMAVPTIYSKLMEYYESSPDEEKAMMTEAAKNLRLTVSGSAALSVSLFDRWEGITGHRMLERYGMTETGMILSNPLEEDRRKGTAGQPLPGVSVRLVDDEMDDVDEGFSGEVLVKGDGVFSQYWGRVIDSEEVFHDGWFRTGDLAILEEGYYRLLGRMSQDIIKSGGHKISALEIEETVRTHPRVRDVSVVAVKDEVWGETVCAALIPADNSFDLDEFMDWTRSNLISHKRPRNVKVMNEFPRNRLGKVVKSKVRNLFEKEMEP